MPTQNSQGTGKIPLIIQTAGFDSSQEELYLFTAAGARTRGYAVLTFEGPSQGLVLRKYRKYMRPDWEVVTSSVIDFVEKLVKERPSLTLDGTVSVDWKFNGWVLCSSRSCGSTCEGLRE